MKKCILGLCLLGLTNLIHAQNELAMATTKVDEITTKTSKTTKIKNEQYLTSNTNDVLYLAACIMKLQKIAADFDLTKDAIYSKNKTITYDVVFEANENYIKAVFDHSGTILSSEEYYEDVRIPYVLSSQLAEEYPGWAFDKSNCTILYSKKGEATFTYNLKLKKGNKSKLIRRKS
jgi:hypothetical protein